MKILQSKETEIGTIEITLSLTPEDKKILLSSDWKREGLEKSILENIYDAARLFR